MQRELTHDVPPRRSRGGRTLDPARDAAIRTAALELLAEVGYDRLTIDAVASRSHAGKPTLYRRWPGKAELVVDALNRVKGAPDLPDTGSLRGDLDAMVNSLTDAKSRFGAQLMVGMVSALSQDAELRRVFADRFITPRMTAIRMVFERGIERGEMAAGRDLDLLARLLPALALQQLVMSAEMPTPDFVRNVVDHIVYPLATTAAPHAAPSTAPAGPTKDAQNSDREESR